MTIDNDDDLIALKEIGAIVRETIDEMGRAVRPGITTAELDEIGAAALARRGARSALGRGSKSKAGTRPSGRSVGAPALVPPAVRLPISFADLRGKHRQGDREDHRAAAARA